MTSSLIRLFVAGLALCALSGCAVADPPPTAQHLLEATPTASATAASPATTPTPITPASMAPVTPTPAPMRTRTPAAKPKPTPTAATNEVTYGVSTKGMDPRLKAALVRATADGRKQGFRLKLNSGFRTRAEQQKILDERIKMYGSRKEALKWASTPDVSMHCKGLAMDVGPAGAPVAWLWKNQARYGICRRYVNEPWHFELNTTGKPCPPLISHIDGDG